MRKILLKSCLLVLLLLVNVVNVNATTVIPDGYTPIYTIADLYAINNDLDGNYILMNDIDMSEDTAQGGDWNLNGTGWTPIENFTGTFDGNGYRIIGMNIYGDISQSVGLFGSVLTDSCKVNIKNLAMVDVNINVNAKRGNSYVCVGSVIGYMSRSAQGTIENCYSTGNISVSIEQKSYDLEIGGIAGRGYNMTKCYNGANISVTECDKDYVGGVAGTVEKLSQCYNTGAISAENGVHGALAGYAYGYGDTSYYLASTDSFGLGDYCDGYSMAQAEDKGCTKYNMAQMKLQSCYVGWNFTTDWEIDPYCDYPYPQLQTNRHIRVKSLDLEKTPTKLEYQQGDKIDLSGSALRITYEDDTSTLVTLTENMLVGLDMNRIGNQEVTVYYRGVSTTFSILIKEVPVSSISLNQTDVVLYRSKTVQLIPTILPANASDKTVVWTSSNKTVATVDSNGNVTGKSKGNAIITATSNNGCVATANVTVLVASVGVQLSSNELTMKVGESSVLTAEIAPLDSTDIIFWSSSDEYIASVVDGTVYANKPGTATITAYTESGVSATCKVTVNKKDENNTSASQKKINSIKAQKVTIKSIKNKKSKKIVLKLSGKGNGTGYQIQYAKNKKFKSAKKVTKKTSTVTISKLTKKKKYYVRVRVYGKVAGKTYYGKWSKVKSVTIKK